MDNDFTPNSQDSKINFRNKRLYGLHDMWNLTDE